MHWQKKTNFTGKKKDNLQYIYDFLLFGNLYLKYDVKRAIKSLIEAVIKTLKLFYEEKLKVSKTIKIKFEDKNSTEIKFLAKKIILYRLWKKI